MGCIRERDEDQKRRCLLMLKEGKIRLIHTLGKVPSLFLKSGGDREGKGRSSTMDGMRKRDGDHKLRCLLMSGGLKKLWNGSNCHYRRLFYLGNRRGGFATGGIRGVGETDEFKEDCLQRARSACPLKCD